MNLNTLLQAVRDGTISVEQAEESISSVCCGNFPYTPAEYSGPRIINCSGRKCDEFRDMFIELAAQGDDILAIHASPAYYRAVMQNYRKARYNQLARTISLQQTVPAETGLITIAVSPVAAMQPAQEAAETCQMFGAVTECIYNLDASCIGRIYADEKIMQSSAIIAVIGTGDALASILANITQKPVIAVPTDTTSDSCVNGMAALLASAQAQTPGIVTVGINYGFAAGYFASLINTAIEDGRKTVLQGFFRPNKS